KSIKEIETALDGAVQYWAKEADVRRAQSVVGIMIAPGMQSGGAWPVAVALQSIPVMHHVNEAAGQRSKVHLDRLNAMTLRGSLLVEAGDTSRARALFETILAEAGTENFFTEHIIAR